MIASRILRIGSPYDYNSDLPIDINQTRVDARVSKDMEDDAEFKRRVQSAMNDVEGETKIKLFPGRFLAQWSKGKVASHGNRYRPLTLPALFSEVILMGTNNEEGNSSKTDIDLTDLLSGVDSTGNLEYYPKRCWPLQEINIEFVAGIQTTNLQLVYPNIRQAIASYCRYSYWQDKEDKELIDKILPKIVYASEDTE